MLADIAVIVPSYNTSKYLGLALKSALNQTTEESEIIVVDDCSTDDSVTIAEGMQKVDSRLRVVTHEKNRGISGSRNTGIRLSRSKYITFLDSDDLFTPDRIESLYWRLQEGGEQSVVYSDWVKVGEDESVVRTVQSSASFRPEGMIFPFLLAGSFRFTAGMMAVPRSCYDAVGFYDETLRWAEDTDMALRLSGKFPFLFVRSATYGWRSRAGSSEKKEVARRYAYESRVLEKHILSGNEELSPKFRKQAYDRLFGCYISSGQWTRLFRMSFASKQAFSSMITIPARIS